MKKRYCIILSLILLLTGTLLAQALLKMGDNVNDYFKKSFNQFGFNKEVNAVNQQKDMHVLLVGHKDFKQGSPSVLSVKVGKNIAYLFAILQGQSGTAHFLVDMDGDGKLDTKLDNLVLPYWIYFPITIPRGDNRQYTKMLDDMYASFQFDGGPTDEKSSMKKSLNNMQQALSDTDTPNRDLFFAMDFYIRYNRTFKEASLQCLKATIQETEKRYSKKHPLLYLFLAETLVKLKRDDDAGKVIEHLLKIDPGCIAALAYDYRLEQDKGKAEEKLKELKKRFPNHWIIKTL